ncbi:nucleotide sugar dehydrogenase [candidate division KSB1 bacterium]|nr:MAG: nucleotide sugar dehydrogenase [candidate division KSB1 bacterium]
MRISVFGLGYVGCVSAACFCDLGHEVWGIDVDPGKVDFIRKGQSPIVEEGLGDLIAKYSRAGTLHGTTSVAEAIANTEVSLICVGTPSLESGALNIEYVQRVAMEIGAAMKECGHRHMVIVRSTMLPGTTRREVLPRLEAASGMKEGKDFFLAYNPEFLREGSAIKDFYEPPKTVVGGFRRETAEQAAAIYAKLTAPLFLAGIEEAEMVKYADNVFHAVKIVFGNEIGAVAKPLGVDSHRVMEIFCADTKLNLSPYYLKPGFAFGGSCLPKDVRALSSRARELNIKTPMLFSLMEANREHVQRAVKMIQSFGKKKIGLLGLAFKAGTDDLRESPMVELVEILLGKGYQIKIYDKNVSLARLVGANRKFIETVLPHLAELLCPTTDEILNHAEVIIVANPDRDFPPVLQKAKPDQIIFDLVHIFPEPPRKENYHGFCW